MALIADLLYVLLYRVKIFIFEIVTEDFKNKEKMV